MVTYRKKRETGQRRKPLSDCEQVYLFGLHAVAAALTNPARKIYQVALTPNARKKLEPRLRNASCPVETVTPKDLDRLLGCDCVHQGAALLTEALCKPALAELAASAALGAPLVILDQITDPHNLGAILRSAAVFGAGGIVMTRRHSPPLAGTVAKAASGALEHVPISLVPNLARAMTELNDLGVTLIGLDGDGDTPLEDVHLVGAIGLVLGAEGVGMRRLTRDHCDMVCRIMAPGPMRSLNVSNAAAVALHLAALRRLGN